MARTSTIPRGDPSPPASCPEGMSDLLRRHEIDMSWALGRLDDMSGTLAEVAALLVDTFQSGHKCLLAGNGGSAAEAQHFAAEMVGRFKQERHPYAAIALSTDSSILTAVANDYGYEEIFARQVEGLGQRHDVLVAFSTSGESENVVRAAKIACGMGITVVAVTGTHAGRLGQLAHITLSMPSGDTALVQELHMVITHVLCEMVEYRLCSTEDSDCV